MKWKIKKVDSPLMRGILALAEWIIFYAIAAVFAWLINLAFGYQAVDTCFVFVVLMFTPAIIIYCLVKYKLEGIVIAAIIMLIVVIPSFIAALMTTVTPLSTIPIMLLGMYVVYAMSDSY